MESKMSKRNKEILLDYLENNSSKTDVKEAVDLLSDSSVEDDNRTLLSEYWDSVLQTPVKKLDNKKELLSRVHHQINSQQAIQPRKLGVIDYITRIAAVLLIPLLVYVAWDFSGKEQVENQLQYAEVTSQTGVITSLNLPDGSKVWLNNFSKIRYPLDFSKSREVFVEGEAYFEVTHRNNDRFVVNTKDLVVEVLGTKFNVSAYAEDLETSVVLSEGKVKISNEGNRISEILEPNDRFSLNKLEQTASLTSVISTDYSAWRNGYLKFREEPLSEVVKKLERWYNVDIDIVGADLKKRILRGTFKNEPIEEVLRLISLTTQLRYTIEFRATNDNNQYERKKITIEKK